MSGSFSPPPYVAVKGLEDEVERWCILSGGETPWHIATIENGQPGDTLETEGATAHLFAAAPDLLEACKLLMDAEDYDAIEAAKAAAGDAILKAKGGAA